MVEQTQVDINARKFIFDNKNVQTFTTSGNRRLFNSRQFLRKKKAPEQNRLLQ